MINASFTRHSHLSHYPPSLLHPSLPLWAFILPSPQSSAFLKRVCLCVCNTAMVVHVVVVACKGMSPWERERRAERQRKQRHELEQKWRKSQEMGKGVTLGVEKGDGGAKEGGWEGRRRNGKGKRGWGGMDLASLQDTGVFTLWAVFLHD